MTDGAALIIISEQCVKKTTLQCGDVNRGVNRKVAKNFEVINVLLDFYGDMLTDKQRSFIELYYNDDLSLAEIAENEGITRQGVRDAIKRAESQLYEMEERLGLAKRFEEVRVGLDEILSLAEIINESNMRTVLSRDINDAVVQIKLIAQTLNNEEV